MKNKSNYQPGSKKSRSGNLRSRIWNSNLFSLVLLVLLILSAVKVAKEIMLRYEINQEIKGLEQELADLEEQSENMNKLIAYLETDEYIEKQARLKLNLSKPGEKQINLTSVDLAEEAAYSQSETPNPVKWFNYFFR